MMRRRERVLIRDCGIARSLDAGGKKLYEKSGFCYYNAYVRLPGESQNREPARFTAAANETREYTRGWRWHEERERERERLNLC